MKIYITGVSRGLGKALAEGFLSEGYSVVGLGRTNCIQHPHFSFIQIDLREISALEKLVFSSENQECMLINNAGVIGSIRRVSEQVNSDIEEVMTVNATVPLLLCQKFLQQIPFDCKATLLNISSGAASRSIPSWATYCASKAALDRFSETIYLEEKERNRNLRVFSISPGVIDTEMQERIRGASETEFSSSQTFHELFERGELQSAKEVSKKIFRLLNQPFDGRVIRSLKDVI
ncbi:MAG: SDR family NAD(P)-dependent oxidoreductase [Cryomorphaceae bacterium]|jgi:benzil reductase ((S)-benzoin forming)|nr:SDR family NAD(P)-dependent oxidoreductase [Cryomorphaceae bacterium]